MQNQSPITNDYAVDNALDAFANALDRARTEHTRKRLRDNRMSAQELVVACEKSDGNKWVYYLQLTGLEEMFNKNHTWSEVLHPHDVKFVLDTFDVMDPDELLGRPEAALLELRAAGISLTKYRVWVELTWNGDERAAVSSLLTDKP